MAHFFMGFVSGIVFFVLIVAYLANQANMQMRENTGDDEDDQF